MTYLSYIELVGIVACAISGVICAAEKKFDLVGAAVLGITTAVGGGITRDIILSNTPPIIFSNSLYLITAFITSCIVISVSMLDRKRMYVFNEKSNTVLKISDAFGLAAFSVTGTGVALSLGYADNVVLCIFSGVITGVGGGLLRDVLCMKQPMIFYKRIYAVASLGGCIIYYYMIQYSAGQVLSSVVSMAFVVIVRILAMKFRWSVPKIELQDNE